MNNRYKLGCDYEFGTPDYIEWRAALRAADDLDFKQGRRIEEYATVIDRRIPIEAAKKRLMEAYGLTEDDDRTPHVPDRAFVIDDEDLAGEMIRVVGMDFVYDFKSGLFMFDLFGGHELTMAYLYDAIKNKFTREYKDAAEQYVVEGYGCYMSSQWPTIHLGEDVAIPRVIMPFKKQIRRL